MKKKVIILGAGWSGIYMLKYALEAGLDAEIYEAKDAPLGIWHYSRLPGGVLRNTHATVSKYHMSPSDFPFPDNTPIFPHHDIIEKHMHDYMEKFSLHKKIQYNTRVKKVKKQGEKWLVFSNKKKEEADFLVVATGIHQVPNIPKEAMYKKFKGKIFHAHYFKEKDGASLKGKKVLIVGGGETACDIANTLSKESQVFVSIRNGQWFQSSIMGADAPADIFYNRLANMGIGRFVSDLIFVKETERWWGTGGTGLDVWKPSSKLLNGFYNKSRDLTMDNISKGEIIPKGAIKSISGKKITFSDKSKASIDVIIFATGYDYEQGLSFLSKELIDARRYKFMFYPLDTTLAFIGFVRPFVGGIPAMAEMQAQYIASVFSEKHKLPKKPKMEKQIVKDLAFQAKEFPKDSKRLKFIVNPWLYTDSLASDLNIKPCFFTLFFTNPLLWTKIFFGPLNLFQYHLREPKKKNIALHQINTLWNMKLTERLLAKTGTLVLQILIFIFILYSLVRIFW